MRKMILHRLTRRPDGDERGMALPLVACMIVVLLGISAFAVDLGWLYLNGARLQRAADSSALAGVVFLPGDTSGVNTQTVNGANANGYRIGILNGTPVAGGGPDVLTWQPLADNRLEVTLATQVPAFFVKLFGFDSFDITRVATAEYIKPVPIGSPKSTFGEGSDNFWASINGMWTAAIQGDPYQTRCDWSVGNAKALSQAACRDSSAANVALYSGQTALPGDIDSDTDPLNTEYEGLGYYYGVEIQTGRSSMTVDLYDPRFQRPNGNGCGSATTNPTGDCDRLTFSPLPPNNSTAIGPDTRFRLYAPDSTPLNPRDNSVLLCDVSYTSTVNAGSAGVNQWVNLCTRSNPAAGIYVLRVTTDNGTGANQYGIRAITAGPGANNPKVYGIDRISIYTNQAASTATLYIAEVNPVHAGKILELRFYDAGEDNAAASYSVKMPNGNTATCEWTSEGGASGSSGPCTITTTMNNPSPPPTGIVGRFNSQWLSLQVQIPANYTCNITTQLGCWWSMSIVNNQPHDRTTWTARIIGNPVRLVPNT